MDKYEEFDGVDDFFNEVIETHGSSDFEDYLCAVISTDQVDTHGHCLTINALRNVENSINSKGLPLIAHHDYRIPPFGKTLAAKLITSKDGKKNFLFGIIATFKKDFYKPFPKVPNNSSYCAKISDFFDDLIEIEFSDVEIDESIIREALDTAPDVVAHNPVKVARKAADPVTVLGFVIPGLFVYPFVKSYMSTLGKNAAESQKHFVSWVIGSVAKKLKRRILYKFDSPYRGCQVDFVVETDKPQYLTTALDKIKKAGKNASYLIDHLIDEEPVKLVYVYDIDAENWIPSYLKTAKGEILTDKPYLMSAEQFGGLSIEAKLIE